MDCIRICVVLYAFYLNVVDVNTAKFQTWEMQDNCGNTIGRYNSKAGEIVFNASEILNYKTKRECQVTLVGETFATKTMLAFYFSEFRMDKSCSRTNIAIETGYPGFGAKPIYGLPSTPFCGHNKTLEEPGHVYISKENSLIITCKWATRGVRPNGTFILKFFSFYKITNGGSCNEDGTDEDHCDSERCIDTDLRCHDELNACSQSDKDIFCDEDSGIIQAVVDSLVGTLKDIGIVIIIIIVIFLISLVYKFLRRKYPKLPGVRQLIERTTSRRQSDNTRRNSAELTNIDDTRTQETAGFTAATSGITDYGTETSSTIDENEYQSPPEVHPTAPSAPSWDSTMAPPPSYDEVLSNEDKYRPTK